MISITDRASVALEELLVTSSAPPGFGVKLAPGSSAGIIEMMIGEPNDGDDVIRRGDDPLLIVDERMLGELEGVEMDFETHIVAGEPRADFTLRPAAGSG
jgi:Fe-S cluster assembly iron-binding protein IscA